MNYSRNIRRTQVAKRIIASWVLIAVVFFLIGLFVGHITSYKPTEEQETEKQTVEAMTKEVVIYGKYDGQEIEPEIKDIDWEVPNDFEPLDERRNAGTVYGNSVVANSQRARTWAQVVVAHERVFM